MLQRTCVAFLCAALAVTSGCATFKKIQPYPAGAPAVDANVGRKPLSKMSQLPVGAYYDEPNGIVVTGHQKGVLAAALFGGVIGVMVANSANKSAGAARYSDNAEKMGVDLSELEQSVLSDELAKSAGVPINGVAQEGGELIVTPYALFSVQKDGKAYLYAQLTAELQGSTPSKPQWSGRYYARAPGSYMVEGDDSWATGTRYADGMRLALQKVTAVLLKDVRGELTEKRKIKAKGIYPWMKTALELPVIVVDENGSELTGRIAVGDVLLMAGTCVFDSSEFTIKPASFKTPQ